MNITEQAAKELKKALDEFDKPGAGIHIYNGKGCCGPSIQMDIANHPESNDTVVSLEHVDFFVEKDLLTTLATVTIDYSSSGFRLNGLKRSGGCCG
jgi:Fe-S cluster assembly iron-binding protein IscA